MFANDTVDGGRPELSTTLPGRADGYLLWVKVPEVFLLWRPRRVEPFCVLVGDANVHETRQRVWDRGISAEGKLLVDTIEQPFDMFSATRL